jgi:hypothetical protein
MVMRSRAPIWRAAPNCRGNQTVPTERCRARTGWNATSRKLGRLFQEAPKIATLHLRSGVHPENPGLWEGQMRSICGLVAIATCLWLDCGTATAANVDFFCNGGSICYFSIIYHTGGNKRFTVARGQTVVIPQIDIGQDTYCVCVDADPGGGCSVPGHYCRPNNPVQLHNR